MVSMSAHTFTEVSDSIHMLPPPLPSVVLKEALRKGESRAPPPLSSTLLLLPPSQNTRAKKHQKNPCIL